MSVEEGGGGQMRRSTGHPGSADGRLFIVRASSPAAVQEHVTRPEIKRSSTTAARGDNRRGGRVCGTVGSRGKRDCGPGDILRDACPPDDDLRTSWGRRSGSTSSLKLCPLLKTVSRWGRWGFCFCVLLDVGDVQRIDAAAATRTMRSDAGGRADLPGRRRQLRPTWQPGQSAD